MEDKMSDKKNTIILENSYLKLEIDPQKAAFRCFQKEADMWWDSDLWTQSLGYMTFESLQGDVEKVNLSSARDVEAEASKDEVRLCLKNFKTRLDTIRVDRALGEKISICIVFRLDAAGPGFRFIIEKLSIDSRFWKLLAVHAPLRTFPVRTIRDDGFTLVPSFQGGYIPSRYNSGYFRYQNWTWERISARNDHIKQLNMNWYGAAKGNASYVAILETPFDAQLDVNLNNTTDTSPSFNHHEATVNAGGNLYSPRLTAVTPVWTACKQELGYARVLHYQFLRSRKIDAMAKVYRTYVKENGYFRSLKDKVAANPSVAKLFGGPDIKVFIATKRIDCPDRAAWSGPVYDGFEQTSTSFDQLAGIAGELKEAGIDAGMLHIGGWSTQGYDNHRPIDTLPINAKAGGESAFIKASEVTRGAGMVLAIHDNYRNLDLNSPSYNEALINIDKHGLPEIGFSSEGGESHQICSAKQLPLLKRTSGYMQKTIKADGYFLDTITATHIAECYSDEHPITRTQDVQNKAAILEYLQSLGLVTGAEAGTFWGIPHVDFYEGMMGTRVVLPVPLFNLVYHDCVVVYWQHGSPYNYESPRGNVHDHILTGLIHGNSHNYCVAAHNFPGWKDLIVAVDRITRDFHRHVAMLELVEFAFLSPDLLIQTSKFEDGTRVVVNHALQDELVEVDGKKLNIPYRGFYICYPDGKEMKGQLGYSVDVL